MTAAAAAPARVDVLAVLDEAARSQAISEDRRDMREAIAAVRELIEAATDVHDFAVNTARNAGVELDRRFYRLRAALAQVSP